LWRRLPVGNIPNRVRCGIFNRPNYAWGVHFAAKQLGIDRISVIEFGVAGGRGLVELERIASQISKYFGVGIVVWGFDAGAGLPSPIDYRDLPHIWEQGDYQMDIPKLEAKLTSAKLIIGDVSKTVDPFLASKDLPPIGFVSFDLDYYSSTAAALKIFDGDSATRLPRVCCYFDDIIWPEEACHNDYIGEYLAIREFNENHATQKLCKLNNLGWMMPYKDAWQEQIYVLSDFSHPLYTRKLQPPQHLPL
jgi:hypothetical protein